MVKDFTRDQLESLIKDYAGISEIPPSFDRKINEYFLSYNMSYLEIARCISYYVETEGHELSPLYGLWFIPNIREKSAAHFKQLELDQQKKQKEALKVVRYQDNNIIFNIKSLKSKDKKRKVKQLDMNDIKIDDSMVEGEDE